MRTKLLLSLLAFTVAPLIASAASLVNINTANATLLDTLPGIGPTYATRIVDYRTAHGPFVRLEDIQNVSGIGPSIYAGILPFITLSDAGTPEVVATPVASSTPSSGAASTYVPPPSAISIQISGSQDAVREVPIHLSAKVTMKGGTVDSAARIVWSFGDGSSDTGIEVDKTYRYAGSYLVVATAYDGSVTARDDFLVRVIPAQARISLVTEEGITIANDSDTRLDLSLWRLVVDTGFFRIPEGTIIMPKSSVMFPFVVINLPALQNATLLYPSGILAYRYEHIQSPVDISTTTTSITKIEKLPIEKPVVEKLAPEKTSYISVQKVEEIINTKTSVKPNETEPVIAPTAVVEPPAVGAASVALAPSTSLFKSVWALGLLGVIALAGVAFVLL